MFSIKILVQRWEWGARYADSFFRLLSAILLFSLMIITCIDVVGRYVFSRPLTGSVEITEIILGCLIFSTLPLITWRKEHISVDLIDSVLSVRMKQFRDSIFYIVVAMSLFVIGLKVWDLAARSQRYQEVTENLEIPMYYFIYFLSISCWFTAVTAIVLIIAQICNKQYDNQG